MTKLIPIDPKEARQRSVIVGREIPVNAYSSNPEQEARKYGRGQSGPHLSGHGFYS